MDWLGFPSKPLVAAASVVEPQQLSSWTANTTITRESGDAWNAWRKVGEIHYATTQQARLVSRLLWDIEVQGQSMEPEQAEETLRAAFGSQVPELAKQAAIHLQVTGGYYLARLATGNWDVLPFPLDSTARKRADRADVLVKVVNPDPKDPGRTDSPVLAALDVATELILARAQARAAARNRTAQLQTVLYPLEGAGPDPSKFEKKLTRVMTAPLADEKSEAVVVPNIIGFQGEWIDKWQTLDLTGPIDERIHVKIQQLIRQLSVILDIPPEILTGMGDTNHWSQWAIQEDNWLGHVEPLAKLIGSGFAVALARAADLDIESVNITPDPAPLLRRRPTVSDALTAAKEGLVSGEWARAQIGADEDDAPVQDQELDPALRVVFDLIARAPSLAADPGMDVLLDQVRAALAGNTVPSAGNDEPKVDVDEPIGEPQVAAATPEPPFSTDRLMAIDVQAVDATIDLLDVALQRVAERVGAQLRARAQGDPELRDKINGVPNERLPRKLGINGLPNLDQTVSDTLDGILPDRFTRLVERAYADTRAAGVDVRADDVELENALGVLANGAFAVALEHLQGGATKAAVWQVAQRVTTIAGGGDDPIPPATVAAPGFTSAVKRRGIALGAKALDWIARRAGFVASEYRWVHNGGASDDHPQHAAFNGRAFNGDAIDLGGVTWYPGDHAGCRCTSEPVWSLAGAIGIGSIIAAEEAVRDGQ